MEHEIHLAPDQFSLGHKGARFDAILSPELQAGHEVPTEDRLEALGIEASVVPEIIQIIDEQARLEGWHLAARSLKWVGERLANHSKYSAAVAVALGIHGGNLGDLAGGFGLTKQAISVAAVRLKDSFAAPDAEQGQEAEREIVRPSEPGEWLTAGEARAACGSNANFWKKIGVRSVICGNMRFYDRASLVEKLRERQVVPGTGLRPHTRYA